MVRRTVSPQKDLRRSIREKTVVYRSLAENRIGSNPILEQLADKANKLRARRHSEDPTSPGVTRSGRKIAKYDEFPSDDSDDDIPLPRRRRSSRNYHENGANENSPELQSNRSKRRKVIIEDDDETEPGSQNNEDSQLPSSSLYDRVKTRRVMRSPQESGPDTSMKSPEEERSNRSRRRSEKKEEEEEAEEKDEEEEDGEEVKEEKPAGETEEDDEEEDEEEETEETEEDKEPRQYQLRARRNPVERFIPQQPRTSERFRDRDDRYRQRDRPAERERRRQRRSEFKRRVCRSDSSSTGDDDDGQARRGRDRDDDRFERRKEISMLKARNRFAPVNLTDKDLTSSQAVIRERMRQTGASCSDVDPMAIDKSVGFDEIGGLGAHIQSLKEVVLFPLLYPDIFQNFNINPPKGVLFYGPPGTGKTLVARALANECSRGAKKVAFFMRKGADCLSKWVGESERQLRILFDQAYAMRPSIIFFDEIDGLAPVRSTRQDQIHSSIVSTLLALMDGLDNRGEVIVIGATNRLDSIDPALRRPGRFDRELRFSLPDSAARLQILRIHTSKWGESKPDDELLRWLADHSSGYCGADLKYLCTEAVMIALRSKYPHIYMSSDRLKLDLTAIKVEKCHLLAAMKRITPASRRDMSIPCRPLDDRTSILMSSGIDGLLKRVPDAYRCSKSVEVTGTCELEKIVRALDEQPPVSAVRLLLCGQDKYPDGGQTSYFLPALLSKLDHLPVHCLSVSKLFSDGRPEETFATTFQSALRSASTGPCILLLPSIDQWFKIVPPSLQHMLKTALDQITGFTPILFLASADCGYDDCPPEAQEIFRCSSSLQMPSYGHGLRTRYFRHILQPCEVPPKTFDPSLYVAPEMATEEDLPVRKLSEKEAKELEKLYENQLREFRIFLRDQLGRLMRDRRFNVFAEPVEEEEAADYYQIIKEPMCFTQMAEKVDRREYTHPDQFLADINLIVNNALEYNPVGNLYSKSIRHSAVALRDIVEEYFEKEFDEDFVEKLEETARLLREAQIVPQNEQLLHLPPNFVRKTRWNVANSMKQKRNGETNKRSVASFRRFRGSTYKLPCNKTKKRTAAIVKSIAQSLSQSADAPDRNDDCEEEVDDEEEDKDFQENGEEPMEEDEAKATAVSKGERISTNSNSLSGTSDSEKNVLLIDAEKLHDVVVAAVQRTEEWPVPELERLAAEMANVVELYRNLWNREVLPDTLLKLVEDWDYEPRPFDRRQSFCS